MSDHPNVQQQQLRKIYISSDDLLGVFTFIRRVQLGRIALVSYRFDSLVDYHFKTKIFSLDVLVVRQKSDGNGAALVKIYGRDKPVEVPFPLQLPPDYLIGFTRIAIRYVDQNVIAFLNCIRRLFGTGVVLSLEMPIGLSQMWESAAAPPKCHSFAPSRPADDRAEASVEQALSKWLHTARTDGRPKVLKCCVWHDSAFTDVEALKRAFLAALTSVSFIIRLHVFIDGFEPFELENGQTRERLALRRVNDNIWLMKRGPIAATAGEWKRWAEWEREALEWNLLNRNLVVIDV
uniref:FBD domain-containing protein n=1 Tax=Globodera pallida TaxID=36090 RepID=A0A183BIA2_GLOPA